MALSSAVAAAAAALAAHAGMAPCYPTSCVMLESLIEAWRSAYSCMVSCTCSLKVQSVQYAYVLHHLSGHNRRMPTGHA